MGPGGKAPIISAISEHFALFMITILFLEHKELPTRFRLFGKLVYQLRNVWKANLINLCDNEGNHFEKITLFLETVLFFCKYFSKLSI